MIATIAAMRTMSICIGFLQAAASQAIVDDEQGLANLTEVKLLTDDEIESMLVLCRVKSRLSGGTVPAANPIAAPVPNPGIEDACQESHDVIGLLSVPSK